MKTMTCKQLGGSCDMAFHANTFEEMSELAKQHGMEMYQKHDQGHMDAMNVMQETMQSPEAMQTWMTEKKAAFDTLAEEE